MGAWGCVSQFSIFKNGVQDGKEDKYVDDKTNDCRCSSSVVSEERSINVGFDLLTPCEIYPQDITKSRPAVHNA